MGILLIAKNNIKKQKGNSCILLLLVALSGLLLYVGISVLSNMENVIDNRNATVNGADYFLFTTSSYKGDIEGILQQHKDVLYEETEQAIYAAGVKYFSESESQDNAEQSSFFFLDKDVDRKLSVINLINEGKEWKENSIILPYYMKVGMGYQTGDIINMMYKEQMYSFEIYGFTEDVMFSTPTNISAEKCYISSEYFTSYTKQLGNSGNIYRASIKENRGTEEFLDGISETLKEKIVDYTNSEHWDLDYDNLKYGTSITANIFMGVLTVFAVLLILISLIIVHFNISNSIEMNMKNIGILEAAGYTSRQMVAATAVEFLMISIVGVGIGLIGAKGASDLVGGIVSSSIGLFWEMKFDVISALFSIAITIGLVLIMVFISSLRYKRISPLNALRNGIYVHNFKKNLIRLDVTRLPLNFAIGIKYIVNNKRKNIAVCLIIVVLSFVANMAVSIYQNLVIKPDTMSQIIGFEIPDIGVYVEENDPASLTDTMQLIKNKIDSIDGINQVLEYTSEDLVCRNGINEVSLHCDIYDDPDQLQVNNVVKGRRPCYNNEIMISTVMAQKLDVSIGDVVYLEINNSSQDYLVVGISQGINHLGQTAMITTKAAERLNAAILPNYLYIYIDDSINISVMMDDLNKMMIDENINVINGQKEFASTLNSITVIMRILCLVMISIVFLVIGMILVLLMKTQIVREYRQFGIYKALGYTTSQLIWQTTMNYIPIVLIGAILGCVIAWVGVNPSFMLCLTSFGIQKSGISISPMHMIYIVTGIVVWAELIAVLCSMRICKITPCDMIQEI